MENTSPRPPRIPPPPSSAPTVHLVAGATDSRDGWRDECENRPEFQRSVAGTQELWWKRPPALAGGVVAVAVASFFLGGALLGSEGGGASSPTDPWVQGQVDDQPQSGQGQGKQPAGLTPIQKSQILSRYCKQQAGGPYNVSEAALLECLQDFEVTDQGMVMPK